MRCALDSNRLCIVLGRGQTAYPVSLSLFAASEYRRALSFWSTVDIFLEFYFFFQIIFSVSNTTLRLTLKKDVVMDHKTKPLVLMGVSMYWFQKFEIKAKGVVKKLALLTFGERHQSVAVGCTKPIPMCIGQFCFGQDESAKQAQWVHRYIFDDLLYKENFPSGTNNPHVALYIENPFWIHLHSRTFGQKYPYLDKALNYRAEENKNRTHHTSEKSNMIPADRDLRNTLRDGLQALRDDLSAASSAQSHSSAFDPTLCSFRSGLAAVRNQVDTCNETRGLTSSNCPIDSQAVHVDHFDTRMVSGQFDTIINPFALLLRSYSFMNYMFGRLPPNATEPDHSLHVKTMQAKCLHYILGPGSHLSEIERKENAAYIKNKVLDYLKSVYDESTQRYVPTEDDRIDRSASETLRELSEIGDPVFIQQLMVDMFRLMHSKLQDQILKTASSLGDTFVRSLLKIYCHFSVNVYTRPQLRNAFHTMWITGLGKRMSDDGADKMKQLETYYLKNPKSFAIFPFQAPYYTRWSVHRALLATRLINIKSSLTDSITDVRTILHMLHIAVAQDCPRAVLYGGMAHTKNITRFFTFATSGKTSLPDFCVSPSNQSPEHSCLCTSTDFKNFQNIISLTTSNGVAQEFSFPEQDQWLAPEHVIEDRNDFFGNDESS